MTRKRPLLILACILALLVSPFVLAGGSTKVPPTVDSPTFADVTATTATLGGTVTSDGGQGLTGRGVEWGTSSGSYPNSVTEGGTAVSTFTVGVTGLPGGTLIYFRAWATNSKGTGVSAESSFTTVSSAGPPTLDASSLSSLAAVTSSAATLGGNITGDGGDTITSRGTVWNTTGAPITQNAVAEGGTTTGGFSDLRSGLSNGTQIFFRSYAININGTGYGPDNSFFTEPATSPASATIDNGGDTSFRINWPANPGGSGNGALVVVSTNYVGATPTDGTAHAFNSNFGTGGTDIGASEFVVYRGTGATNVTVTGLSASTTYDVAVFYSAGTGSGETGINYRQTAPATNSQTTNTPAVPPTVTVATPASITSTSALLGGNITNNGGAAVTDRGVWWHTSSPPESGGTQVPIGSGDGAFSQTVSGMPSGTTIYVRAYAINSAGTSFSTAIESFSTLVGIPTVDTPTVADITATSATLGGTVQSDGGGTITQRGTVWGTALDPDIVAHAANVNAVAGTTGLFTGPVTGLPTGTLVYFRAFATNSAGTAYSASSSFTPSSPPVMGPPTKANINYFSALLGGIITSDGGNPIQSRGTVWNTTGTPVVENVQIEGGTTVSQAFSHTRFLTAGDTVFYRAYATTVVGTGYSAEDSFIVPTEPDVQATLVTFPRIAANSLRISWTRGNGEGSIVVLRLTADGITAPLDGNDYTANPDFTIAPELPTNSNNFVVYKGSNNAVVVTGLTLNTSYSVAVYEYAGSGAAIDYLKLPPIAPAEGTQSTNDIPVHNLDYNVDCTQCHNHGGSPTYVPEDAAMKTVCQTCHDIGQVAAGKLEFDLHLIPNKNPAIDFVDCGYCHEVHNPNAVDTTESQHPIDLVTRTNKSFLRANVDKYVATAVPPAALHTDDPGHADPPNLALTPDRATEGSTKGYCQVCHTLTNYHRNVDAAESNQCHDGLGGDEPCTNASPEINCGQCHQHNNKFIGVGGSQTCIECHSSAQGARPIITTQFAKNSTHIPNGDSTATQPDCLVCHNQGGHQSQAVSTWDVDNGVTSFTQPTAGDPTTTTGEGEVFEGHCMSCHDDGSADSLAGGDPDQTPTSPFTGSGAPPVIDPGAWVTAGHNRPVATSGSSPVTCVGNGSNGCHASGHGSDQNFLLAPATGAVVSPTDFCYVCHDSDGPSSIDIQAQFNISPNYTTTGAGGAPIDQKHDLTAVSCKDCHSPHVDNATNPVADPDTALPLATYSIANSYNDPGSVSFSYDSGGNLDPVNPEGSGGGFSEPDSIQFCLTCHDGNAPAGVAVPANMEDLSDDYANRQHGSGDGSDGSRTGKGNLKVPWTTPSDYAAGNDPSSPYAAMQCTTCHGAHGSGNIFNLHTSITVGGVQMQIGGDAGSEFDTFSGTTYTLPVNGGSQNQLEYGAWCTFCHNMNSHAGVDETTTCQSGHQHGSSAF